MKKRVHHLALPKTGQSLTILLIWMIWWLMPTADAFAKRQITVTAVGMPSDVIMQTPSTTAPIQITNSNTGGDTAQVNSVQFNLLAGYTWNIGAIVPPSGWTVSQSGNNLIFTTTTNAIPLNQSLIFNLVLGTIPQSNQDVLNEAWLTKVIGNYDAGPPPANNNSPGIAWNRRSLLMTLVASPTSVSASVPNNTIILTMTVTNRSSATQSGIVSNPNPPTMTTTASGFTITRTAGPTPATLSLPTNQFNTITWTYTVTLAPGKTCPQATPGTVTFTAQATNGAATSGAAITSNPVSVGCFIASLSVSSCAAPGDTVTVTTTAFNFNNSDMTNLRSATLTKDTINSTASGTATCGAPTYSSTTAKANNGSSPTITWSCTLPSTASAGQTYIFQGQVTGTLAVAGNPSYTTPLASSNTLTFTSGSVTATPYPTTVSAGSDNVLITWTVTNGGCGGSPLTSVGISLPSGWIYLLNASIVNGTDDWADTTSGSPTGLVTYSAGTPMPLGANGSFSIVFLQVPTTSASYVFTVSATNGSGTQVIPTTVTVGPAATGGVTKPDPVQEVIP
jgi:hypothetical protein